MPDRATRKHTVHPADADLKAAGDIINNAKKPLFIGGTGVGFSSCTDCLGRFIDKTGMPFILLR